MKRKTRSPTPLAFHGVVVRAHDPNSVARKLRRLLGWRVLRMSSREIVLGDGPELFVAVRRTATNASEGIEELHLAVEAIRRSRRKTKKDSLGGDSWSAQVTSNLGLVMRELQRAPGRGWVKPRGRIV